MVDGGDLFFSKPRLEEKVLTWEKIRARTTVEGFNRIGTDAITIGEDDLTAGLPFLKALADSARFPFLSATLVDPDDNLIFAPYSVVEKRGFRIGLVGVSSEIAAGDGYHSRELLPSLKEAVEEVYSRADIVILLFHGTDQDKQAILASGLPIDLILQSHVKRYDPDFGQGLIPVMALGTLGKYLNVITATVHSPDQPLVDLTVHRRTLTFVENSLQRLRRNQPKDTPLEELYADQPRILERIKDLRERESMTREIIVAAVNTIESERVALDRSVRDDQDILALVNAAKRAIEEITGQASVQASKSTPRISVLGSLNNQEGS